MASSRRNGLLAALITVLLVVGAVVTLNALRGEHLLSDTSNGPICQRRLSWVTTATAASLRSIVALSRQNAWAVGAKGTGVVVMHWDGSNWSDVALPALDATSSALDAVAAVNERDIWAVGTADRHPLILHWNGVGWSQVETAPLTAYGSQLSALAIVASNDVWAVGNALQTKNGTPYTIAERWDGHAWRTALAPPGSAFTSLTADVTTGAVWGFITTPGGEEQLVRWNGQAWQDLPTPDPSAQGLDLQTIAAGPDGAVWAAGSYYSPDSTSVWAQPIVEHWDAKAWSRVPTSETESRGAWLTSVAVGTDGTLWAAGSLKNPNTRLLNVFMEQIGERNGAPAMRLLRLYPSVYTDPHTSDSFTTMAIAAVPGANAAWLVGTTGSPPDSARPPIDSNLPVASGAFMLSYC